MALKAAIIGRYRRYKTGTNVIVQWLADTAHKNKDLSAKLRKVTARLSRRTLGNIKSIKLKTRELVELAEAIIDAKPPIEVPAEIIKVLQDVIDGREQCADFYATQAMGKGTDIAASNESHSFFIEILKKVQTALGSRAPGDRAKEVSASKSKKTIKKEKEPELKQEEVQNLFECLAFEEEEAVLDDNSPEDTSSAPDDQSEYVLEDEQDDAFALWCFLADLNDIRAWMRTVWEGFRDGEVSLMAAGMVTEMAFGIMQRSHDEFAKANSRFKDWSMIGQWLRLKQLFNNNVLYTFCRDSDASVKKPKQPELRPTDTLSSSAGLLLRAYANVVPRFVMRMMKSGQRDFISTGKVSADEAPDLRPIMDLEPTLFSFVPEIVGVKYFIRSKEEADARYHHTILTNILIDSVADGGCVGDGKGPWGKGSIGGLSPPTSHVFIFSICMDIQEVLSCNDGIGSPIALDAMKKTLGTISGCLDLHERKFKDVSSPERAQALMNVGNRAHKIQMILEQDGKTGGDKRRDKATDFGLRCYSPGLAVLPHAAGEITYNIKLGLHEQGTVFANDNQAVIILAHLWKVLLRYGLVQGAWADMDFITAQHHGRRGFVAETSADADSYGMLRHFMMDIGVDASAFSNGRMPPAPSIQAVRQKAKRISVRDSKFTAAMLKLFNTDEQVSREHGEFVNAILAALAANAEKTNEPGEPTDEASSTNASRLTPIQMLETFKANLIEDEPRLNFDYIGFSRSCLQLLEKIMLAVKAHAPQRTMNHGHEVAYFAIKSGADAHSKDQSVSETVLTTVAKVMRPHISSNGKKFSTEAFRLSSGHIPKENRPRLKPASMSPIPQIEIDETMSEYFPGGSVGSSRKTIEIYDPEGSVRKFNDLVFDRMLLSIMPYGVSRNMGFVVPDDELRDEDFDVKSIPGTRVTKRTPNHGLV